MEIKIEREEEKRVTVSFDYNVFCGRAVIINGKLDTLELNPSGASFWRWLKTKDNLRLLYAFLEAIEEELLYEEEES